MGDDDRAVGAHDAEPDAAPAREEHMQGVRGRGGAGICQHQRRMSACKECGAPAHQELMQGVRGREHQPAPRASGANKGADARSAGRTSVRISSSGADARSAGGQASARLSWQLKGRQLKGVLMLR